MRKPCFVEGCPNHANRTAIFCAEHWNRLTIEEKHALGGAQFRFAAMTLRAELFERDTALQELEALATLMAHRSAARPGNAPEFTSPPHLSSDRFGG